MCIAIAKNPGVRMNEEELLTCFINNSDGAGFAFIDANGEIQIEKFMEFDKFLEAYQQAEVTNLHSHFLIHFRIKTHGETSLINCHPFRINDDMAFIHNGIIKDVPYDKTLSDTQMFNQHVLQKFPEGWEYSAGVRHVIEEFIGWSKLCVLSRKNGGEVIIYNESKGEWNSDKTVWYSNTSYKPRTYSYSKSDHKPYHSQGSNVVPFKKEEKDDRPFAKKCDWCFGWPSKDNMVKLEWCDPHFSDDYVCLDCLEDYITYSVDLSKGVKSIVSLKTGTRRDIHSCWQCGKLSLLDRTKTGGNFCSLNCEDEFFSFGVANHKSVVILK